LYFLLLADVGIAMGSGVDVAKQAADVILLDDNFATIVIAIEEGRIMFDNLKKCFLYILASNVPEIAAFILFLIGQIPLPIGALAILCIDLGTDMLPAISLAYEEEEVRYEAMKKGPRNPRTEGLLDEKMIFLSCGQIGLVEAAAGFLTYFVIMAENGFWPSRLLNLRTQWESRAINDLRDSYDQEWTYEDRKNLEYACHAGYFWSIVLVQWVAVIMARSKKMSIFQRGMNNHILNFSLVFETLFALMLINVPGLNTGLQMGMLNPIFWFPPIPFIIFLFTYDEVRKAIIRKFPGDWVDRESCLD
jgi:sodium/potassium-transporting ATPase subunit alpha